ncbi:MAG: hypothetical protein K5829_09620 [Treponema sp.]|nr:hypothetical protein [Treponema sp.]
MTGKRKSAFILNLIIFIFTLFATISMIIGFNFMDNTKVLSATSFKAFKYFTVDSNVFAGIISLVYLIYELSPASKKKDRLPKALYILKLAATTGVTLTMMVTVFFLAPRTTTTYFAYFKNSNLFMHLLTPLLCIISFIFFEAGEKTKFPLSLSGIIPMLLYALYYMPNILLHLENGKTSHTYDWYGFLDGGLSTIWFVIPLLFSITWLFSIALWGLNKKIASK